MANLIVYKGDDTDGSFGHSLSFTINVQEGTSLTGCTAKFTVHGITKSWTNIVSGQTVQVVYSHSETAAMPLGATMGVFQIVDANGKIRTFDNAVPFYVTKDLQSVYNGTSAVSFTVGTAIFWNNINNKPSFASLPANDLLPDETGITQICDIINSMKTLLRSAFPIITLALMGIVFTSAATAAEVQSAKLSSLVGKNLVVTNVTGGIVGTNEVRGIVEGYNYVTSVNGHTGSVTLVAADVGAIGATEPYFANYIVITNSESGCGFLPDGISFYNDELDWYNYILFPDYYDFSMVGEVVDGEEVSVFMATRPWTITNFVAKTMMTNYVSQAESTKFADKTGTDPGNIGAYFAIPKQVGPGIELIPVYGAEFASNSAYCASTDYAATANQANKAYTADDALALLNTIAVEPDRIRLKFADYITTSGIDRRQLYLYEGETLVNTNAWISDFTNINHWAMKPNPYPAVISNATSAVFSDGAFAYETNSYSGVAYVQSSTPPGYESQSSGITWRKGGSNQEYGWWFAPLGSDELASSDPYATTISYYAYIYDPSQGMTIEVQYTATQRIDRVWVRGRLTKESSFVQAISNVTETISNVNTTLNNKIDTGLAGKMDKDNLELYNEIDIRNTTNEYGYANNSAKLYLKMVNSGEDSYHPQIQMDGGYGYPAQIFMAGPQNGMSSQELATNTPAITIAKGGNGQALSNYYRPFIRMDGYDLYAASSGEIVTRGELNVISQRLAVIEARLNITP